MRVGKNHVSWGRWFVLLVIGAVFVGAAVARGDGETTQPAAASVSVFQLFLKGGFFMYPLAACSIAAVALVLDRLLALRRSQVVPASFLPGLRGVFPDRDADAQAALQYCRDHDSPIA